MAYRQYFYLVLGVVGALMTVAAGLDYVVDPLQFYHRAAFYSPAFSVEQRFQNPGLAKNYPYDTIIIGSSMVENSRPSMVDRVMGVKSINLAMAAASAREERLLLELAIRQGHLRTVILGLDYGSLKGSPERVLTDAGPFPYYLYDERWYNDYRYLLSASILGDSLEILYREARDIPPEVHSLDELNNWADQFVFSRQALKILWDIEREERARGLVKYSAKDPSLQAMGDSFDANILPLVADHPDIQYRIYYPPYSILRYRALYIEDPQLFYAEMAVKRHIFQQLQAFPNVELYDFQADPELTFDLDQYKDFSHHTEAYNELIIQSIASQDQRYLVTADNIEAGIAALTAQVENLDEEALFSGLAGE